MKNCFVALPKKANGKLIKTYLYNKDRKSIARQVLWGDWLSISRELNDGWLEIAWSPNSAHSKRLYIPKSHTTCTRPLEIVFLDVGQGDGAVLITPERNEKEAVIVIDAGETDNMHDFLVKRFKPYNKKFKFHAAVITHPDKDHYNGFSKIFKSNKFGFDVVYHNGLVERPITNNWDKVGGRTERLSNGKRYLADLAHDKEHIERLFGPGTNPGDFCFPQLMKSALENPNIKDFRMLSTQHGKCEQGTTWVPGFAPSDGRCYSIEVVGPIVETLDDGKPKLRTIHSYGKTKNGHSVLLRLHFGDFRILFGGDLNEPAEKFLLKYLSELSRFPKVGSETYCEMVKTASAKFGADIMKVCHHGSEKVTDAFLQAVNPVAFVISSGDREGHVHPRPDLLGRLGKQGRSSAPVLLSTELQRATREKEDSELVDRLLNRVASLKGAPNSRERRAFYKDIHLLGRSNVTVYGTIYLKTDGHTLITAFRIETGSQKKKWFTFQYKFNDNKELELIH